jgi:hypothetical protein
MGYSCITILKLSKKIKHRADWMYERKWGAMVHYLDYFEKIDDSLIDGMKELIDLRQ